MTTVCASTRAREAEPSAAAGRLPRYGVEVGDRLIAAA